MQLNNALQSKLQLLGALAIVFSLYSCGSFQYAGNNNDGVYGESNDRRIEQQQEESSQNATNSNNSNSEYYKDYFKEKSQQYNNVNDSDDVIFTDIDSYHSDYEEVENDSIQYETGYAGWGEDNKNVTINIYNRPYQDFWWRRFYVGHNLVLGYDWRFDPYWFPVYGSPWNGGWINDPWCYNNFYYRYGYRGGVYSGFYPWYYGRRRAIAYNNSRRNSIANVAYNRHASITRNSANRTSRSTRLITRPGTSRPMVRPNNSSRPRVNTSRPGTSRPMVRPSNSTRPRITPNRPGTSRPMVRPNSSSRPRVTPNRPGTSRPMVRPSNSSRPRVTRPASRPSSSYSRPSSSSRGSMRSSGSSRSRRQ
jgi:hypothetical protein